MLMYTEAAASDAVAFGIIDRLRRWVVRQSRFAQIVIGIRDVREIGPFRSQKIEAHGIDRHAVKRYEKTIWPRIIERRHLPFAVRRAIHVVVSIEPIDKKKHGFLAEILVTQKIGECGVTCRTIFVVMETIVRVLAPVGIDTRSTEQILRAKGHA